MSSKEAELREKIKKINKTNKILILIVIIGIVLAILGAIILAYYVITQMGNFTSFFDIIEGSPYFFVLLALGGLIATIGYIPSFFLSIKKARLLDELKELSKSSPACTR
jgi:amino acid transporter